jgi:carnitine 3-dehydrogenase
MREDPAMADITHVAVLGAGTIGAGWAANFLAQGLSVAVSDPAPHAEAFLHRFVEGAWPALTALGLAAGADPARVRFTPDPAAAVEGTQFVQENAPERLEVKQALFARVAGAMGAEAILSSSSSTLMPSAMQDGCAFADRLLLGHPFNPPHLIPLVEVCAGQRTDPAAVDRAIGFYRAIGKHPIRLNKEMPGHVSNRLQSALWREASYLVEQGVVDVTDVDAAIAKGPGLRWALMGPIMTYNLAGGQGGLRYLMDHIPVDALWPTLGTPDLTPAFREALIAGVNAEAEGRPIDALARERDRKRRGSLGAVS